MKKKSETFSSFKKFKAWAENQTGLTIEALGPTWRSASSLGTPLTIRAGSFTTLSPKSL